MFLLALLRADCDFGGYAFCVRDFGPVKCYAFHIMIQLEILVFNNCDCSKISVKVSKIVLI